MPSIFSTFVKRVMGMKPAFRMKKMTNPIPSASAIRVGAAVLLVLGVVGASKVLTRRPARAAVLEAPRPQEPAPQAAMKKAEAKPAAKAATPSSTLVTITGCLEQRDETFRLKDTDGPALPTARTWKTVFLKKGPAPIEIVDAANRLKFSDHVGQRVNVTGTLVEREMQVRSLRRVAESCSKTPQA